MTAQVVHGYGPYTRGCRCVVCRQAKADYMRARRARGRAYAQRLTASSTGRRPNRDAAFTPGAERALAVGVKHGTRYAYEEHGCRCGPCTTARTSSDRRYRQHLIPIDAQEGQ